MPLKERQELPRYVPPNNKITLPNLGFALDSRGVPIKVHAGVDHSLQGKARVEGCFCIYREFLPLCEVDECGFGCVFSVAKSITIGDDVLIACGCTVSDYSQHPLDPEKRILGMQVDPEDVRPVRIENRAWLGKRAMILPHPRQVDAPTVSLWTWRVVVLHLPLCPAAATE